MTTFAGISGARLRQIIEQVEYLEEQKAAVANDMREVFGEAKSAGFDVKVIRQILKMRKMDQEELQEQEAVLETYLQALKMTSPVDKKEGTPGLPKSSFEPTDEKDQEDQDAEAA